MIVGHDVMHRNTVNQVSYLYPIVPHNKTRVAFHPADQVTGVQYYIYPHS